MQVATTLFEVFAPRTISRSRMKRVRVAEELFGDTNFHADRLARLKQY